MTDCSEQQIDEYVDFIEKKHSTIKSGENIVHLEYFGRLIGDNDIANIEKILLKSDLELSHYDKTGDINACLEDFAIQVGLFLNEKTCQDVLLGIGINALWDAIKQSTFYVWKTVRNKTIEIVSTSESRHVKINCGIKMSFDKNTKFDFKIDGEFTEEIALKSIDKILEFLKEVKTNYNQDVKPVDFVVYDKEKDKWIIIDVNKEIRKKMSNLKETRNQK
ncbi:MAG: hypothetical protein IT271_07680 [Chitinophagales bacterium]|nr:hypothetical protein [Chitinophagales bacterium]